MKPDPVLELQQVTYRRGTQQILHGIDLTIGAGEHWALLGPNGAAASTWPPGNSSWTPSTYSTAPIRA